MVLAATLAPVVADAQTSASPGFAKAGAYAGISSLFEFTLDGVTFDGQTVYKEVDGDELGLLPKLDEQNMFRGVLGFRGQPASLEFSYERTRHNGDFFGETIPSVFQAINIDLHGFFLTRTRVQPYVMGGLAFPWLTIEDGAFSSDEPDALVGNGVWRGQGLNLGGGVTVFAHPRAGVRVGYAYRVLWFNRARGVSGTVFRLIPRFRETSGGPEVMAFFTF